VLFAQSFCKRISYHKRYTSVNIPIQVDNSILLRDSSTISVGSIEYSFINKASLLIKRSKDGAIVWSKAIRNKTNIGYIAKVIEAPNGNIVATAAAATDTPFTMMLFDKTGSIIKQTSLNAKELGIDNGSYIRSQQIITYGNDSLVFLFSATTTFDEPREKLIIVTTDSLLNIGNSFTLLYPLSGIGNSYQNYIQQGYVNNGHLKLFGGGFFLSNSCYNVNGIYPTGIFYLDVDITQHLLVKSKAFCPYAGGAGIINYSATDDGETNYQYNNIFFLKNGNIAFTKSYMQTNTTNSDTTNILFGIYLFDKDFNYIKSDKITTTNLFINKTGQELVIDSNGNRHFAFHSINNQAVYYAVADENNRFILQKKLPFASSVYYNSFTRNNVIKKDKLTAFNIISNNGTGTNYDAFEITARDTAESCFGTNVSFLNSAPFQITALSWAGAFEIKKTTLVTGNPDYNASDFPLIENEICLIKHICDTIALHAPDTVCNIANPVIITAHKNIFCDEKVNFIIDSSATKSIKKINDTTVAIIFAKSWQGKIYATINSCTNLTDSAIINISAPAAGFSLGNDTLLCKGKNILINAPAGFKQYLWNDNSTQNFLNAGQPGSYYVTATDFCNRSYADTLIIKEINKPLYAGRDSTICATEKILLQATTGFLTYNWKPVYNMEGGNKNTVLVYPENTTSYIVTAEKFKDCFVSDTVKVNVINCPQNFHIANAFTPNNDGVNDIFKPAITGVLSEFEFCIYNHWGQLVFKTNERNKGWDGNLAGLHQNTRPFIWVCKFKFAGKQQEVRKATVMLLH
jgi:gliding motility-associated-like protein